MRHQRNILSIFGNVYLGKWVKFYNMRMLFYGRGILLPLKILFSYYSITFFFINFLFIIKKKLFICVYSKTIYLRKFLELQEGLILLLQTDVRQQMYHKD